MMEQNEHLILFIDDNSSEYIPVLNPVAKKKGYKICAVNSVLEGLEYLKKYPETVSAVILDIKFPISELQGIEGLRKIKKIQSDLPVIMLTERDSSEDIDTIVECIKIGAYNYVAKRLLKPIYLFQIIDSSIQQAVILKRLNKYNSNSQLSESFFTITSLCKKGRFKKKASFGFELISINEPNNIEEENQLEGVAVSWHENLLKSISNIYRDEVQLNLRYIAESNKIRCFIIVTVYAINDLELEKITKNIHNDVSAFFSNSISDITNPYYFDEIRDSNLLENENKQTTNLSHTIFYRKPLKVKLLNTIGFNSPSNLLLNEDNENYFDEIFPYPTKRIFGNELLKALLNQNDLVEINIELIPKQLLKHEIDLIRQLSENKASLDLINFSKPEIEVYLLNLKKFINTTNDKFLISVVLIQKNKNWMQHLKTGIINYFFGSGVEVLYQNRELDNLRRFSTTKRGKEFQLPFVYSNHEAIQAFRLPFPSLSNLPGIRQQSNSFHFLPNNLVDDGILMGEKKSGYKNFEITIAKDSLARHLYIMGQTGTGKSTMLKTMIKDCLSRNEGFAVIDPHGDLYDEVLELIPKNKIKNVSLLNPSNCKNSVSLNPLKYDIDNPQSKSLIINELMRAFRSMYDMNIAGGPMFETFFKNGLQLLMDEGVQNTSGFYALNDLVKIFQNSKFRDKLLLECTNNPVKEFFKTAMSLNGENSFSNFALYVSSKLTRFVEDAYLAPLLTSKTNNIDFKKLMDEGNILLVRMDKGLLGADNTSLLGQIVLSNLFTAAMSRTKIPKNERKPFYIFVDEFQNFVKGDVGSALSEVRKYGLNLILANQTLGQLDYNLVEALLGNVGSLVFFRPGINDYEKIRNFLEPDFKRENVLKLPNFNCIARLLVDNIPSDPFVFQTIDIK